jgi:hypothetical protein
MKNERYIATSLNVFTLLIGISVGLLLRPSLDGVHAQVFQPQQAPVQRIEEIEPVFTAGSGGIGILLSNRVETDSLVVNGYDVMKLNEGLINYLATRPTAERADLENIIKRSKAEVFYKIKQPAPPKPAAPDKKEPK